MKRTLFYFILLLIGSAAFIACGGDDNKNDAVTLEVSDLPATVAAGGANVSFSIQSNASWTVSKPAEAAWLKLLNSSGANNGTVGVAVDPNPAAQARSAVITVTAGDKSKEVVISQAAFGVPDTPAGILGNAENTCPDITVRLNVQPVPGAASYQWYKDDSAIPGATASTYLVTESGVYAVAGVNSAGEGPKSGSRRIDINKNCPPAAAGPISGNSTNNCPERTITLTVAPIQGATSYQWSRVDALSSGKPYVYHETSNTITVASTGTYTVAGVNENGEGTPSAPKVITYTACPIKTMEDITGGTWYADELSDLNYYPISMTQTGADELTITGLGGKTSSGSTTMSIKGKVTINADGTATLIIAAQTVTWSACSGTATFAYQTKEGNFPALTITSSVGETFVTFPKDSGGFAYHIFCNTTDLVKRKTLTLRRPNN